MLRTLTVCALAVLTAPAVRAADDTPKAVIERAIKAHGGDEAISKFQGARTTNKGKITIPGVGETEFTQKITAMLPDKIREAMDLEIGGQRVSVTTLINGDKITIEANGMNVPTNDDIKAAIKDAKYVMKVARLAPLVKDKGFELSSIGESKVNNKPAIGVRVASKDQKDVSLYFDKETGLLAKVEHRTTPPGAGAEVTEERIVVSYKKERKNGMPIPDKVVVKHDGKSYLEAEVVEIEYVEKIDDSEFTK